MTHERPRRRRALPPGNDPARYVYVELATCPTCGSARLRAYKTLPREADGARSRYTRCLDCAARCIVVAVPP